MSRLLLAAHTLEAQVAWLLFWFLCRRFFNALSANSKTNRCASGEKNFSFTKTKIGSTNGMEKYIIFVCEGGQGGFSIFLRTPSPHMLMNCC